MNILLNGQPIDVDGVTPEVTLANLLEAMHEDLNGKGLTPIEVIVDGSSFSPDDSGQLAGKLLQDCQAIEIVAATAKEMLVMGVEDSGVVIPHLEETAQGVAGNLRIGKVKPAMDAFLELVDGLEWLATILINLEQGYAAAMQETGLEIRRKQLLTRINEHLTTLRTSQEKQDWVGLADILEYEFPEVFKESLELFGIVKAAR